MSDERPRPDLARPARALLNLAGHDLTAAEVLGNTPGHTVAIVGFHCQQAVEKAFKAVIGIRGALPPRTHDLILLHQILDDDGAPPLETADLEPLMPFAAELRYAIKEPPLDIETALQLARTAVAWAESLVPEA